MGILQRKFGANISFGSGKHQTPPFEGEGRFGEGADRQLRELLEAMEAVRKGDLTRKLRKEGEDIFGELAVSYNGMVDLLNSFGGEVTRVAKEVGTEGKLGGKAEVPGVAGTWKDLTDNVNVLASNLTNQVRNIAQVATAISAGDLTQQITVEASGEILDLKNTLNKMVDDLNRLTTEISRVAQVAGTEGNLSERAKVEGVTGSWKEIVDTLNSLIDSIAKPVQEVIRLALALSQGDLTQRYTLEARGDIKTLTDALNKSFEDIGAAIRLTMNSSAKVSTASNQIATSSRQVDAALMQSAKSTIQIADGAKD